MPESLSIALVSPHAWPPYDDLTWRIAAEGAALARRGHAVTILAPGRGPQLLAESRRVLSALREGEEAVVRAAPGSVRMVPIGRALAAGRRRLGGPLDLAAALQDVLSRVPFDVVHVHEPLAPTPALAALRHARGVTAATFHRPEQVAGIAFVRPLVDRAIARVDVMTAASETARRAVTEMFARDAAVIPDGVAIPDEPPPPVGAEPPPLVVIGRSPDRGGVRFGMGVVRALGTDRVGPVTVVGAAEAHWRTLAAIPKALRPSVTAVADSGPQARDEVLVPGAIALVTTPEDLTGSITAEAMARGMVLIVPRSPDADALVTHDGDGLVLPPFSREAWAGAIEALVAAPERRARLAGAAFERARRSRNIDDVAAELERLYLASRVRERAGAPPPGEPIVADLRVHAGATLTPREITEVSASRGLGAVAVIGDGSIALARETAQAAPAGVAVVVGQQVHTTEGALVGLFLREEVRDGQSASATVEAIRAQGGLVMVPHPAWGEPPPAEVIAELRERVDCYEVVVGPASALRGAITIENARLMQRLGLPVTAGSGATTPDDVGSAHLRMRPFTTPAEFLAALTDADPVQRRRGLRPRTARERRRPGRTAT